MLIAAAMIAAGILLMVGILALPLHLYMTWRFNVLRGGKWTPNEDFDVSFARSDRAFRQLKERHPILYWLQDWLPDLTQ